MLTCAPSATAITWGFNFVISFSWLPMLDTFGDTGAFCWYAVWNIIGWFFCYFFLPETKNLTLEELDVVFSVKNRDHAAYYAKKMPWYIKKYLLFQDVPPMAPLYQLDQTSPSQKKEDAKARADRSDQADSGNVSHEETIESKER